MLDGEGMLSTEHLDKLWVSLFELKVVQNKEDAIWIYGYEKGKEAEKFPHHQLHTISDIK